MIKLITRKEIFAEYPPDLDKLPSKEVAETTEEESWSNNDILISDEWLEYKSDF